MKGFVSRTLQIFGVETKAESGITPPPRALPRQRMSGTTPQWSTPNILPVRPSPVWTSSAIRSVPYSSQALRIRGQKSSGGTIAPGFALHRLHDDAGDALAGLVGLVELVLDGLRVAELHEVDAREQRQERLAVLPLAQERQRAAALAVKPAQGADEVGLAGVQARASLIAPSTASVPLLMKKEYWRSPGEISPSSSASAPRSGIEQLLARERHAGELVGDRPDDLGVADARAVDAVAAEAVDVRAARQVLERRALARPLQRRVVPHLDHGLAVLEVAAVVIGVEVVDRVGGDLRLLLGVSSFAEMMSSQRCDSWISSCVFMCVPIRG